MKAHAAVYSLHRKLRHLKTELSEKDAECKRILAGVDIKVVHGLRLHNDQLKRELGQSELENQALKIQVRKLIISLRATIEVLEAMGIKCDVPKKALAEHKEDGNQK